MTFETLHGTISNPVYVKFEGSKMTRGAAVRAVLLDERRKNPRMHSVVICSLEVCIFVIKMPIA